MKIKITYFGKDKIILEPCTVHFVDGTWKVFDNVTEAGVFLMELFKDDDESEIMGRITLDRLRQYVVKYPIRVERIDHSLKWKGV